MSLRFDVNFENTALKNQAIMQEIEGLKRFITPDPELLDGHDMIGYRLERERASVEEIEQSLKDKSYIDPQISEEQNNQKQAELLAQIREHQSDIQKLETQRVEIPKAISRLERLHGASLLEITAIKLPKETSRDDIKKLLKNCEARLKETHSQEEKRVLTYLVGQLETAKTTLDTGKELQDVYLYLHQSELKHLAKLETFKNVHHDVAGHMLQRILTHITQERDRLSDKQSPLVRHFDRPIQKLQERIEQIRVKPESATDKQKALEVVAEVDQLSMNIQVEKAIAPTFKDRLRGFVNSFRSFMDSAFGIKIPECEALRSKTMTNMFNTQQEASQLARVAPSSQKQAEEQPRPKM